MVVEYVKQPYNSNKLPSKKCTRNGHLQMKVPEKEAREVGKENGWRGSRGGAREVGKETEYVVDESAGEVGKQTEGEVVEDAAREVDEQTERELGVGSYIAVAYGHIWYLSKILKVEDELYHLSYMTPYKWKWGRNEQGVMEKDDILMEVSTPPCMRSPTGYFFV